MKVRKAVQHYILVSLLWAGFVVEAVSGFVLWFALPHGGGGGRLANLTRSYWSLSRDTWVDIHDWAAIALVCIVVVHIAMHWKWVVRVTAQLFAPATRAIPRRVEAAD